MPRLVRNPVLDPPLVGALVRLWTTVTNAAGAVGFVPPVVEADVRPVAEAEFAQVAAGAADLVVAFEAAGPVGFGLLVRNTGPVKGHWATIARLQRDPGQPGRGIGSCVLAELERAAAERDLEFVALSVRAGVGLAPYYEARGYRLVAVHPGWLRLGPGELRDELLFVKPLHGPAEPSPPPVQRAAAPPTPLPVRRLDRSLPLPAYAHPGDAGLDLRAREHVTLAPGERATVPTGLAVAVPPGFVGLVHPRSGLAARHGLSMVNAPGTIDSGYRGEIKVILVNHDPSEPVRLRRGDRIAQLLIQRVETVTVVEAPTLDPTPRAERGLGSTGLA